MLDEPLNADLEDESGEVAVASLRADAVPPAMEEPLEIGASWQEVADNRLVLLSTLFFVTAVLGLPLLWKSRAFSGVTKVLLTIVVLAYTAFLFGLLWLVLTWSYNRVVEAL